MRLHSYLEVRDSTTLTHSSKVSQVTTLMPSSNPVTVNTVCARQTRDPSIFSHRLMHAILQASPPEVMAMVECLKATAPPILLLPKTTGAVKVTILTLNSSINSSSKLLSVTTRWLTNRLFVSLPRPAQSLSLVKRTHPRPLLQRPQLCPSRSVEVRHRVRPPMFH